MTKTLLNNRYQVIQVLGAGGFGETFLAEDTHLPSRRRCVIKQLKPITNDPQTYQIIQQRFEREATILEHLGRGNDQIPELYAYFSEDGLFYLVQEWIHGQTLFQIIQTQGYENEINVRQILLDLLPVLDYVHSQGIIHRDIKPDNIILRSLDRKPVLIDFGAVKETIRTVAINSANPTRSLVIGTPGYMPSEQAIGRPVYATDIYSLGLTAIFLLTGKQPEELPTHPQTGEILWQNYAPSVSPQLAMVLNQAIKPHTSDRFTTANKLLYALQAQNIPSSSSTNTQTVSYSPPTPSTQATQALSARSITPVHNWQKPTVIFSSLIVGGLISGVVIAKIISPSQPEVIVTKESETPTLIPQNQPVLPKINPPSSISSQTTPTSITAIPSPQQTLNSVQRFPNPTPQSRENTPSAQVTANPQLETESPISVTPKTEISLAPEKKSVITQNVPAFPTGTSRSNVESVLGKPNQDLRGLWKNTRAVTYNYIPKQIDLGYLFDRQTGVLRQTEAAFAPSVNPQVMQATLNGLLGGQATQEIKQGLQQIQQRNQDNFTFTQGSVKGQIVRQSCDFIYISIWDQDLHDFVRPADAKQC